MIQNNLLHSIKAVVYPANSDRRIHNDNRIATFGSQIYNKYVYRFPLKYFCDIGKINFPRKTDMKIRLSLKTEIKNCSNLRKNLQLLVHLTRN